MVLFARNALRRCFLNRFNALNHSELTKRLTFDQQKKIKSSFSELENEAYEFSKSLQTYPYDRWDIKNYSNWTSLALLGQFQAINRLTDQQVATISLIQSAVKSYLMELREVKISEVKIKKGSVYHTEDKIDNVSMPREVTDPHLISICSSMEVFHEYLSMHLSTIISSYIELKNKTQSEVNILCNRLASEIIDELEKVPLSERFLFLVPLVSNSDISNYDRLLKRLLDLRKDGFSLLNLVRIEDSDYILFFSFSLMKIILNKLSPDEKTIDLVPTFGEITVDEIYRAKKEKRKRLFNIGGLDGLSLPDTADTFQSTDFSFSMHDGYHGFKDNAVLEKERQATFKVVEILSEIENLGYDEYEDIKQLLLYLKDGDLETNFKLNKPWGKIFELQNIKVYLKDSYLYAIIRDMVIKKDEWENIGISREDLTEHQKHIYDFYDAMSGSFH